MQRGDVFQKFMTKLLNHPQVKPLLSDDHFSVDGTLIEAWASQKSFKPKDGSGDGDGANWRRERKPRRMDREMKTPQFQLTPEKPVEKYSDDAATPNVRKWGACDIVAALSPTNC